MLIGDDGMLTLQNKCSDIMNCEMLRRLLKKIISANQGNLRNWTDSLKWQKATSEGHCVKWTTKAKENQNYSN